MSTKIYNGFLIRTSSIKKVQELVLEFRPYILKESNLLLESFLSQGYTRNHWIKRRLEMKHNQSRDREVDTQFDIIVFPYKRIFLGIAYTDHDEWFNKWLKMPLVEEYGYWNNTDPPDDIPYKKFRKRGEVWDKALGPKGIPSMYGFNIEVNNPYGPI